MIFEPSPLDFEVQQHLGWLLIAQTHLLAGDESGAEVYLRKSYDSLALTRALYGDLWWYRVQIGKLFR